MEEKFKKFQNFDWVKSELWQSYYRNLYPTPPPSKLDKYKRKFYKLKIDPEFDINYKINQDKNNNNSTNYKTNNNYNNYTNYNNNNKQNKFSYTIIIESMILFFFLISIVFNSHSLFFCFLAYLIRTYRECGIIKFNIEYLQNIIINESFQNLMYNILLFIDKFNYYLIFPSLISSIIDLSENLKILNFPFFKNYIDSIIKEKNKLIQDKSYIEVLIGFFLIIGKFFNLNSYLIIILYWQLIRIKYSINPSIQTAFSNINKYINNFKNQSNCPSIIKLIIDKIQMLFQYFNKLENKENKYCNIF